MQRLVSRLAVAAVVALVAVAAVDAFRDEDAPPPGASTTRAADPIFDPRLATELARERIDGTLTYTASCATLTLGLPGLEELGGSVLLEPRCEGEAQSRLREPGATVVRDGRELVATGQCLTDEGCRSVRFRASLLDELARRHPLPFADPDVAVQVEIVDVVWLAERAALLVEVRSEDFRPQRTVGVLDGGRVAATYAPGPFAPAERLEASPLGGFLTVRPNILLTRDAEPLPLPALPSLVSAIAWSPDERWTAFATRGSVWFARTAELLRLRETGRQPRLVRLPLHAEDLAWGPAE